MAGGYAGVRAVRRLAESGEGRGYRSLPVKSPNGRRRHRNASEIDQLDEKQLVARRWGYRPRSSSSRSRSRRAAISASIAFSPALLSRCGCSACCGRRCASVACLSRPRREKSERAVKETSVLSSGKRSGKSARSTAMIRSSVTILATLSSWPRIWPVISSPGRAVRILCSNGFSPHRSRSANARAKRFAPVRIDRVLQHMLHCRTRRVVCGLD